jgi:segregation and condensation protein B
MPLFKKRHAVFGHGSCDILRDRFVIERTLFTMLGRILRGPETRQSPRSLPQNHRLPDVYRYFFESMTQILTDSLTRDSKLARLEAVLFLADEPLTIRKIVSIAELTDAKEARQLIAQLIEMFKQEDTPFQIEEIAGGYQFLTRAKYHPWLVRLQRTSNQIRLSSAAMETLAIIAYRQPIMRADIESIRGVQCGEMLSHLIEKGLIKIVGRHDSLGRPVLYGTTKKFLQIFGLKGLDELHKIEDLRDPDSERPN